MLLSVITINRNLENINNYITTISNYVDIEFIFVGNYYSYNLNLSSDNVKFLDLDTDNLKKSDLIDEINGENILFLDNEALEKEYLEIVIKEIQQSNTDIFLFRNSFDFTINPYIEYNNMTLSGEDFFGIIMEMNRSYVVVLNCVENNFFVKVFKNEYFCNIDIDLVYTIIFDVSIFIYAKSIKYIDKVISMNTTNYYNHLSIDIFKDIYDMTKIYNNYNKKSLNNFLDTYISSLWNFIVNKYIDIGDINTINQLKNLLEDYKNDFLVNLKLSNDILYGSVKYKIKMNEMYKNNEYNIYYIMKSNKNKSVISDIEKIVHSNQDEIHILILDDDEDYNINKEYFNEVYILSKLDVINKKYVFLYKLLGLKYMYSEEEIKHNIFLYTEKEVLAYSIKEDNICVYDDIDDNNRYCNSKKLKDFSGYKDKCYAHMEHSMYYGNIISQDAVNSIYPTNIVFSKNRYNSIKSRITRPVFKIGPYINYCNDFINYKIRDSIKNILGKVLLVIPSHTVSTTMYYEFEYNNFLNYIENIKQEHNYDTVIICVFHDDIYRGFTKIYNNREFIIVSAGALHSEFFYNRLKTIINISDHTISNKVGTHLGYCLFLGKPHTIYKCDIVEEREPIKNKNLNEAIITKDINFKFEEFVFVKLFSKYKEKITDDQYNLCNLYYGFDQIKTKEEIKCILDFSKNMYLECKSDIDNILVRNINLLERKIEIDNIYYKYILNYLENNKNDTFYKLVFESMCDFLSYLDI